MKAAILLLMILLLGCQTSVVDETSTQDVQELDPQNGNVCYPAKQISKGNLVAFTCLGCFNGICDDLDAGPWEILSQEAAAQHQINCKWTESGCLME